MTGKGMAALVAEANETICTIDGAEALRRHAAEDVLFVDVRETQEWMQGHIPGALHVPRGLLEAIADPDTPAHKPELRSGKPLVLYCGSGARSALAGKTLGEMGYENISHVAGGLQAWLANGGPIDR